MTISFDEFIEKFRPVQNSIGEMADMDGILFAPFGNETDFVRGRVADKPDTVWTLVGDSVESGFIDGGDGHIVTELPFTEPTVVEVEWL